MTKEEINQLFKECEKLSEEIDKKSSILNNVNQTRKVLQYEIEQAKKKLEKKEAELLKIIEPLSKQEQKIIIMKYINLKSCRQIAVALYMEEQSVRNTLVRVKNKLSI